MENQKLIESLGKKYEVNLKNFDNIGNYSNNVKYLNNVAIPSPINIYSAQGSRLQTSIGEVIDMASMTVNTILGQNDPWINSNIIAYMLSGRPSFNTAARLGSKYYFEIAKKISEISYIKSSVINHLNCNGSDVTELAVKTSYDNRSSDKKRKLMSFKGSYHGQNLVNFIISDRQRQHRFFVDESPVIFLDEPTHTQDVESQEKLSESDMKILEIVESRKDEVFALIIEPIQVNNTVNTPSKKFLQELVKLCKKSDITVIFDEIQTCFGWLGTYTAAEKYGIEPNIMTISKALTAGYGPLSVLVSEKKYGNIKYFSGEKTNGADLRSIIAAKAVIERLEGIPEEDIPDCVDDKLRNELKHGLLSQVDERSQHLFEMLSDLKDNSNGLIGRIKGYKLIRSIEILDSKGNPDEELANKLFNNLLENGVFTRPYRHTLLFKPSFKVSRDDLNQARDIILAEIKKLS